jgi:putative RNA 2'-phosphotransferase
VRKELVGKSKFISLVLRHKPEEIGLKLDVNGWADVNELLQKGNLDLETLKEIVATNEKKRFAFNDDCTKIRASQGHSIDVNLNLKPVQPPNVLYHGTAEKFLQSIRKQGILKGKRQHVHLSPDVPTARMVGSRHGKPIVLLIGSELMYNDHFEFYLSDNNVWLVDHVPKNYILEVYYSFNLDFGNI